MSPTFTICIFKFLRRKQLKKVINMSTFVSVYNPITGKSDWVLRNEDYDFHQEIARSAYADMLHDTERNRKYYDGLRKAIQTMRGRGERVHVLDIGTGTGLLSMMAASLGADEITACEAFLPMGNCAKQVIKKNGFADKIDVNLRFSTSLTVGPDGDMKSRANILITEVFDTELIGEGAIETFTHAHKNLLTENCIVVPTLADMYIQVVNSDFIRKWRDIHPIKMEGYEDITTPAELNTCGGAPSLHDLQLDQLSKDQFQPISEPFQIFRFDFSGKNQLPYKNSVVHSVKSLTTGKTDGVFMWWDLKMDEEGEIILSCAPRWAHPNLSEMQWRDHWMQAIYYPSVPLNVSQGEEFKVISNHDQFSLWFEVTSATSTEDAAKHEGPVCTCGAHVSYSRSHIGIINDPARRKLYEKLLKKYVTQDSICLCLGDGNLLPLMAARLGAKKVISIEEHFNSRKIMESIIKTNNLGHCVEVIGDKQSLTEKKINLVIGQPYFQDSVLPWHNMAYWYAVDDFKDNIDENAVVLPVAMTIKAMAVDFKDLWKIRAPVRICEGFDLNIFDSLIETSSDLADEEVEPQPLWEYPCTALSDVVDVYTYNQLGTKTVDEKITVNVIGSGTFNGVALWTDFDFGDGDLLSTGPREKPKIGEYVKWDFYTRQGVHLLKKPIQILSYNETKGDNSNSCALDIRFHFAPNSAELSFKFDTLKHES